MYSTLVKEPFNLRLHEIANLTDQQIVEIYFRPDNSKQSAQQSQDTGTKKVFMQIQSAKGIGRMEAEKKWNAEKHLWLRD